ncbi:MAG: type II secretion system protein [Phycisphaerae bacterium]|nr:type II secretion system protein [Phycisphaerae bacterium]
MRREKAFTLIELLVVIAVIALLMAILMPALQRAKRQTKTAVCLSNLRQWGVWFSMYTEDNDDKFFRGDAIWGYHWRVPMWPYYKDCNDVLLCPMAAKCKADLSSIYATFGSKFSAWHLRRLHGGGRGRSGGIPELYGSYGLNAYVNNRDSLVIGPWVDIFSTWRTTSVSGANDIPVFFDCIWFSVDPWTGAAPPDYDDDEPHLWGNMPRVCIDRHDGHINSLFMDFSVRKVGLKELWTLKWHRTWNTANEWTIAGGVKPEDWPEWMRKFKDY